jgi:hypothetical protein
MFASPVESITARSALPLTPPILSVITVLIPTTWKTIPASCVVLITAWLAQSSIALRITAPPVPNITIIAAIPASPAIHQLLTVFSATKEQLQTRSLARNVSTSSTRAVLLHASPALKPSPIVKNAKPSRINHT